MAEFGAEAQGFFRRLGITGQVAAVLMIGFGLLIIAMPGLVVWLLGLYLILAGAVQLAGHIGGPKRAAGA
ncbi:MAG TPA: hypothetical protein VGR51_03810 [Thermoplasmata archaeon]|jgi:type IV secretory pathway TrbD component|nr:hypothetical protein [Thermoplasmata archaeon]